ncbi:permease prefix domain 1-containing protein [Actinophytocola sp. KF-1]
MTTADPIAEYVVALARALHGPRRTRRSMVAEAREGLIDAAEAYRAGGAPPERAAALAVRDFGTVPEVAPSYQDELTARQGRWAAVLFALVFPGMLLGWDLLWSSGAVRRDAGGTPELVRVLAAVQDVLTVVVAAAALALLVTTFRRTVSPRRLTNAIGLTGAVGAGLCGGTSLAMNVAGGRSTVDLLTANPAAVAAFACSAVVMVLLVWLGLRTLTVAKAAD